MNSEILYVGIGGALGSIVRYFVYSWMGNRGYTGFPWGTLFVNALGCFLIGVVATFLERGVPQQRLLYFLISMGALGGFTTFSAFGLETFNLIKNEAILLALLNATVNVIGGLCFVWLGRTLVINTF